MDLTQLFSPPADPSLLTYGVYDPALVVLSLAIAIFASSMALQVAGQAAAIRGSVRAIVLLTGSVALGSGVWAMHFIGMLAFNLCAVTYDPGLTAASMLPSLAASFVALSVIARKRIAARQLLIGGVLVGAGIGAMHYTGMAAMQIPLAQRYDPFMFALSIVVAVVLAIVALWVRFGLTTLGDRLTPTVRLLISGAVMGCAIAGMHYTGMAAARWVGHAPPASESGNVTYIAIAVVLITVMLTILVVAANSFLRAREMFRSLSENENRLQTLLATAVDGVITMDGSGTIREFNASAERIFGWKAAEIIGRDLSALFEESEQSIRDYLQASKAHVNRRGKDVAGRYKDGSPVSVRLAIGHSRVGESDLFVAFVTDMSERNAMEQLLRQSEQQFRSLIGNIPGVSYRCLLEPGWPFLFVSDAVLELTGYPAEDFLGWNPRRAFDELIHPEDRENVQREVVEAVANDHSYLLEYRLLHRDGSVRWMWGNGGAVRDDEGKVKWLDGVILDISERKRAELEVQRFSAIVASSGDAIIGMTLDGTITSWNQGAENIFGHPAALAIGRSMRFLLPEPRADEESQVLARIGSGEAVDPFETVRRRHDGKLIDVASTVSPIRDENGKIVGASEITRDITERRQMENDLRAAKERAEQAAAARAAFMANMSHEIRTPMNAIIGFTDVLLQGELAQQQRRYLDTVRGSARSLLRLLNEILDSAKLEKGAVELELSNFDLLDLVDELSSSLGANARKKGLALGIGYDPALPTRFHGDELRVRQVLTNLLGNAIKFTERGNVSLDVESDGGRVHFKVRDTGIGIPADRLAAIFDPFTQADASMSRRFGGTGLGTTISKQLVELMGGKIWVESTVDVGTTFHVLLPLAEAIASAPSARRPMQAVALPPLRLLIVDDVPQNLELLSALLGDKGHALTAASGGGAAVELAGAHVFDLILMDMQMPGMDGLEATRRIRAHAEAHGRARTPIIALTASVLQTDRQAARQAGMEGFASKPVELVDLSFEIARVLGLQLDADAVDASAAAESEPQTLNEERALQRWGGQQERYGRALQRFRAEHAEVASVLMRLCEHRDVHELRALAHRLKGASANLGLELLAVSLERVEAATAVDDAEALSNVMARAVYYLRSAFGAIDAFLAAAVSTGDAAPQRARVLDIAHVRTLSATLVESFKRGELDDAALAGLADILSGHVDAERWEALQRALDDFDFAAAQSALAALLQPITEAAFTETAAR